MKVNKKTLLLIAGIVWGIAGVNILRIGILAYAEYISVVNILLSIAVFTVFYTFIFNRLTKKHTKRILGYEEEKQFFLKFFDIPSFIIMAIMMTGGILMRELELVPMVFIAFFYTGIGSALLLAGIIFFRNFIKAIKS